MSDSANDLADLAYELDEAELTADPNCPSLAQVLWNSLPPEPEPVDRFNGFDGIPSPPEQP